MAATTIKVSVQTRDRIKALGDARHKTAEQVIAIALDELEQAELKRQARADSLRLRDDPQDAAELRQVMSDMEQLRAW